jgi:hypothetical protein
VTHHPDHGLHRHLARTPPCPTTQASLSLGKCLLPPIHAIARCRNSPKLGIPLIGIIYLLDQITSGWVWQRAHQRAEHRPVCGPTEDGAVGGVVVDQQAQQLVACRQQRTIEKYYITPRARAEGQGVRQPGPRVKQGDGQHEDGEVRRGDSGSQGFVLANMCMYSRVNGAPDSDLPIGGGLTLMFHKAACPHRGSGHGWRS